MEVTRKEMENMEVLTAELLLNICETDGIPIGGAEVKEGLHYDPYYMSGTEKWTEIYRVGTWCSPEKDDEVTVFAIVTSSLTPTDLPFVESWLVCWVEDMGDWGTNRSSYILPFPALKKYFQRWLKEQQRQR